VPIQKRLYHVMPDPGSSPGQALIRHPEAIEIAGFRLPPEWRPEPEIGVSGWTLSIKAISMLNSSYWP